MSASTHHFFQVFAAEMAKVRKDRRAVVPPPPPPSSAPAEKPEWYTLDEAAVVARVCTKTLRTWPLPFKKPGKKILVRRIDLEKYIEAQDLSADDAQQLRRSHG